MCHSSPLQLIQLTPHGRGAVATLRVEGEGALRAVQSHFHARGGRALSELATDRLTIGRFGGERGEEVVVRCVSNNAVELHCHGGTAVVAMIQETLAASGCRCVSWRDWTTGDCPNCLESTLALADARTERCAAILLDQYHGALQQALNEIRANPGAQHAQEQIDTLLTRVALGQHLTHPWSVVLAGRPNVGKSSLLNALAGHDRAIVHHTPGTTRDAVTHATVIEGWPVELCDTAGLRDSDNTIEQAGIELAHERLAASDLVLLVSDHSEPWSAEDQAILDQWPAAVVIHNKCDLPRAAGDRPQGVPVSALRGDGIEELLQIIANRLVPNPPPPGAAVPFTPEQVAMIATVATTLRRAASCEPTRIAACCRGRSGPVRTTRPW